MYLPQGKIIMLGLINLPIEESKARASKRGS